MWSSLIVEFDLICANFIVLQLSIVYRMDKLLVLLCIIGISVSTKGPIVRTRLHLQSLALTRRLKRTKLVPPTREPAAALPSLFEGVRAEVHVFSNAFVIAATGVLSPKNYR